MKNKRYLSKIIMILNVVLAVIVGVLGISILSQTVFKKTVPANVPIENNSQTQAPPQSIDSIDKKSVSVLNFPGPRASASERQSHFQLASKTAVQSNTLVINSCTNPSPLVLKLKNNQKFIIKNSSKKPYTLVLDPKNKILMPAEKDTLATAAFNKGPGLYGYSCEGMNKVVGLFYVTP